MLAWLLPMLLAVAPGGPDRLPVPADTPRLTRIAARTLYADPRAGAAGLPVSRLERFAGDPVPERVVFEAEWTPGRAGLAGGARMTLEYEVDHGRVRGVRETAVPGPLWGPQRTSVEVPVRGGAITAWRLRILEGHRLLIEQRSRNWGASR